MKAVKLPADLGFELYNIEVEDTLESLREGVGGGYIEIVRTPFCWGEGDSHRLVMVIDEEGAIKQQPLNYRASVFYPSPHGIYGEVFLLAEVFDEEEGAKLETLPDWLDAHYIVSLGLYLTEAAIDNILRNETQLIPRFPKPNDPRQN